MHSSEERPKSRIDTSARDASVSAGLDEKALEGFEGTGLDGAVTKGGVEGRFQAINATFGV